MYKTTCINADALHQSDYYRARYGPNKPPKFINRGKMYNVVSYYGNKIIIIDDSGGFRIYRSDRFKITPNYQPKKFIKKI